MNAQQTRMLVTTAVFGALGGVVEITLGSVLHSIPVLPFRGLLMSGILAVILVASRIYCGRGSAVFRVGAVIALLKIISPGGVLLSPACAILLETLAVGGVFAGSGKITSIRAAAAGVAGCLMSLVHKLIFQGIIMGMGIIRMYREVLQSGAAIMGIAAEHYLLLIGPIILLHLIVGIISGSQGVKLGRHLKRIMGSNPDA